MSSTSYAYFQSVLHYLAARGCQSDYALAQIEYTLPDKAQRVPFGAYRALLNFAAAELDEPLFGFYLGQHIQLADYGALGYLVDASANLKDAIKALLAYDVLVADIGKAEFVEAEKYAWVGWQLVQSAHNSALNEDDKQLILRNMTAWVATARKLQQLVFAPTRIEFSFPLNSDEISTLTAWFGCEVQGSQPANRILFPNDYLHLPFNSNNPVLYQALKQLNETQRGQLQLTPSYAELVRQTLQQQLDLRHCKLPILAASLGISTRHLQRKLNAEQSSFAVLLQAEQQRRATLLLGTLPLAELAWHLGFAEQAAFNKAFRRWFGCTPKAYAKK